MGWHSCLAADPCMAVSGPGAPVMVGRVHLRGSVRALGLP